MPAGAAAVRVLQRLVAVRDEEVAPVAFAFGALFSILASYFLLLPLRDDAGISLGTSSLPLLFVCSLCVTLLVTPAASAHLTAHAHAHGRDKALRWFYTAQAAVLLVFYACYNVSALEGAIGRLQLSVQLPLLPSSAAQGPPGEGAAPPLQPGRAATLSSGGGRHGSGDGGDAGLTMAGRALRGSFFVWAGCMNLVTISSVWARAADAFRPEAGARLFGFIAAGATLGQLAGSMVALGVAAAGSWAAGGGTAAAQPRAAAPASCLLLIAALLQLLAAQMVCRVRPASSSSSSSSAGGHSCNGGVGRAGTKRAASLASVDSWPAQLSCDGRALLHAASLTSPTAGVAVPAPAALGGGAPRSCLPVTRASLDGLQHAPAAGPRRQPGGGGGGAAGQAGSPARLLSGFKLVLRSSYLLLLSSNLLLTYLVGSLAYFQRVLLVASSGPSLNRTAFFAMCNTWSAAAILLLQLFATSSLLRRLGLTAALSLCPLICLSGLLALVTRPSPTVIAVFELARKTSGYALLRPARELLFTVVSRDEKYGAKLLIDTLVQRAGDAAAAAVFEVLDVRLQLGHRGVGLAACLCCVAWLATALALGRKHDELARQQAHREASQRPRAA